LGALRLALIVPRPDFKFEIVAPAGKGELDRDAYGAIADALAERPRTVRELLDLPTRPKSSRMTAAELVGVVVGQHQAAPVVERATTSDQSTADRLTLALAELLDRASGATVVGVPVLALGGGLRLSIMDYSVLTSFLRHGSVDFRGLASEQYEMIVRQGGRVLKEGQPVEGKEESLEILRRRVREITDGIRPVWQQFWPAFSGA
jgi:hypothetical protein